MKQYHSKLRLLYILKKEGIYDLFIKEIQAYYAKYNYKPFNLYNYITNERHINMSCWDILMNHKEGSFTWDGSLKGGSFWEPIFTHENFRKKYHI